MPEQILKVFFVCFLRNKITENLNSPKYNDCEIKILSDGIFEKHYVAVFLEQCFISFNAFDKKITMPFQIRYGLIIYDGIEIKKNYLKQESNQNYIVFGKTDLIKNINKYVLKGLLKRALFLGEKGKTAKYNALFSLQRLVGCVKTDINHLEVHHMDKNTNNNFIGNLLPIAKTMHEKIGSGLINQEEEYNRFWQKSFDMGKNTLAKNILILFHILYFKKQNKKIKEIEKLIHHKIKKSKIYEILRFYFSPEEFLIWLRNNVKSDFTELYGNCQKYYDKILDFEKEFDSGNTIFKSIFPKKQQQLNISNNIKNAQPLLPNTG